MTKRKNNVIKIRIKKRTKNTMLQQITNRLAGVALLLLMFYIMYNILPADALYELGRNFPQWWPIPMLMDILASFALSFYIMIKGKMPFMENT